MSTATRLTLDQLVADGKPVYVRNRTRPRGRMQITFVLGNGKTHGVAIPRTHLPICLNDHVPPETIRGSHEVRSYINKGVLELVDPAVAEKELSDPANREELDQLRLSEFSAKAPFVSERASSMEKTTQQGTPNNFETLGITQDQINARVLDVVSRLATGDLQVKAGITEIRNMEDELTPADLSYIIAQGPDGQIKQYAQTLLAKATSIKLPPNTNPATLDEEGAPELTPAEKAEEARRETAARTLQQV